MNLVFKVFLCQLVTQHFWRENSGDTRLKVGRSKPHRSLRTCQKDLLYSEGNREPLKRLKQGGPTSDLCLRMAALLWDGE